MTNFDIIVNQLHTMGKIPDEWVIPQGLTVSLNMEFYKEYKAIEPHTFTEWHKLGKQVKKGEHGTEFFIWKMKTGKQVLTAHQAAELNSIMLEGGAQHTEGDEIETQNFIKVKRFFFFPEQVEQRTAEQPRKTADELKAQNKALAERRKARATEKPATKPVVKPAKVETMADIRAKNKALLQARKAAQQAANS